MFAKKILGAAAAAIVALGIAAGPASADRLLYFNPSSLVPLGTNVEAVLVSSVATIEAGGFTIECDRSRVTGDVSENPGGTWGYLLTDDVEFDDLVISFGDWDGSCDENILIYSVSGAEGTASYAGADADSDTFTLYNLDLDLHLYGFGSVTCQYTGNLTGNFLGTNLTFNGAWLTSSSGFPCPGSGTFTAEYELRDWYGNWLDLVN